MIYLVNRNINPVLYNFICNYCPNGKKFDKDLYSLSELIQWIWRSAIRNNKPIFIYIPSERMLNILINWLNNDLPESYDNSAKNSSPLLNELENTTKSTLEQGNIFSNNNDNPQNNINFTNNIIDTSHNSTNIPHAIFTKDNTKSISYYKKEEKFKQKCFDSLAQYINGTTYETNEVFLLIEEELESLNDKYPYEIIHFTIKLQDSDLIIAKYTAISNSLSEEDFVNSLFKVIDENLENAKKQFDFNEQLLSNLK